MLFTMIFQTPLKVSAIRSCSFKPFHKTYFSTQVITKRQVDMILRSLYENFSRHATQAEQDATERYANLWSNYRENMLRSLRIEPAKCILYYCSFSTVSFEDMC